MRFTAVVNRIDNIEHIKNAILVLGHLTHNVVFKISEQKITLIANPGYVDDISGSRGTLDKDLFEKYSFKGLNDEENLIYFEVQKGSLVTLFGKLKSLVKTIKFRLVNGADRRHYLKISIEYPSVEGSTYVDHNVHIKILKKDQWAQFEEDTLQDIQVSFYLPPYKDLNRTFHDFSGLANIVLFEVKFVNEQVSFKINLRDNTRFNVFTRWNNLELCQLRTVQANRTIDQNQWIQIPVNVRQIEKTFRSFSPFKATAISCTIFQNRSITFHFFHDLGSLKVSFASCEDADL